MVQPLTKSHIDSIVACYDCANERFEMHRRPNAVAEDFLSILAEDTAFGWFINEHLTGFISYGMKKDIIWISSLYVDTNYGRLGIAAKLLNLALNTAREAGARACVADCLKEADWAVLFYQKHGFAFSEIEGEPWALRACKVIE